MKRLLKSFAYAFKGLKYAFTTQPNFKIHTLAAMMVIALGWYLRISQHEWLWVITGITLVLILELINTALEVLTDIVSPGYNKKAGYVKDLTAGAVLLAAIFSLIIFGLVFLPKLLAN